MPFTRILLSSVAAGALALPAFADIDYDVEVLAEELDRPWAMAFLPDEGDIILTLRGGGLMLWNEENGTREISGAPEVISEAQGGLLDIAVGPNFDEEGWLYMTWVDEVEEGSSTHVGRAKLDRDEGRVTDLETLFVVSPGIDSARHFGSRIVFRDDFMFVGFGDRNSKDFSENHISQDLSSENGSVIRLTLEGEIPSDNPFHGLEDHAEAIWSYGHRNIQAMTVHPDTGDIWITEHGEAGGDEINVLERGGNFGWPLVSFGVDYRTGEQFAEIPQEGDGFISPIFNWPPGRNDHFPPSGMTFYTGDAFPDLEGHLLIGNLFHEYLGLFSENDRTVEERARLLDGEGLRIRDVAIGPDDGFIYVLADGEDAPLLRLTPP